MTEAGGRDGYTENAKDVIGREQVLIEQSWKAEVRGPFDGDNLGGLALSGGGIRSASFAMGVMQALANEPATAVKLDAGGHPSVLQRLHYLSTVSGGGYAGTAVTKLLSDADSPYDLGKNFPFRVDDSNAAGPAPSRIGDVRYRASYLDADAGPVKLNAIAVVARTLVMTFTIYMVGLSAVIGLFVPLLSYKVKEWRIDSAAVE